ncbi:alpha/beta hydrolase fold family protein [Purpureocillium lavendulum]|uniref:Alpha/beta hydrolase fold family protein n=1 Tax=Purpureocillium lavendulum TaxID=1247861 RepID=A0AB34FZS0_9HYPO|nr:alpha/beta hydrolase fold family protein [Purpureocillium lavendulum]
MADVVDNSPTSLDDFLRDPRFRRTFALPPDAARGRPETINVTYADYGYHDEQSPGDEEVFLFFAPLVGSRMWHVAKDDLAKRHKVRIVNLDRPGVGGTDEIPAERRMAVWRDVVMALLAHLGIRHVALGCQSGGTVHALDLLLHHPEVLHPTRPYLAIGAPWILPSHSGVTTMTITQALPRALLAQAGTAATLVNKLAPIASASFGASQALYNLVRGQPSPDTELDADALFEQKLQWKLSDLVLSEGIDGMSQETILLMQRTADKAGWDSWGDYDGLAPRLTETLRAADRQLAMDVYFAETDGMVGDAGSKGPRWFEDCWKGEEAKGAIQYTSSVVAGAEHDTIWNLQYGAMQKVLARIGSSATLQGGQPGQEPDAEAV